MACLPGSAIYLALLLIVYRYYVASFKLEQRMQSMWGLSLKKTDEEPALSTNVLKAPKIGNELRTLLENLPNNEKYGMLIKSLRDRIFESGNATFRSETLESMKALYTEMIQYSYKPDPGSVKVFLDVSSYTQEAFHVGIACRLIKAGGSLKSFGAAIGQLSSPIGSKFNSPMRAITIPTDNRKAEVIYASAAISGALLEFTLQSYSLFDSDVHAWATLGGAVIIAVAVLDLTLRQGTALRTAAAGIERLILTDTERQQHCDASSFLMGYLLGLPCFCFKPNVAKSVMLLQEQVSTLDAFKQPAAIRADRTGFRAASKAAQSSSVLARVAQQLTGAQVTKDDRKNAYGGDLLDDQLEMVQGPDTNNGSEGAEEEKRMALGRVLIWQLASVAAEQLRYGKTVLSDPKMSERLLDGLARTKNTAVANSTLSNNDAESRNGPAKLTTNALRGTTSAPQSATTEAFATARGITAADVPTSPEDRAALLEWAYFEAVTLVRQHADVLERVREYLATGTSSVGETALMIDDMLC